MSVALYIIFEQEMPGFDASSVDGKYLEKALTQLDGIARSLGLVPLATFISGDPSEAAALLGDAGDVPDDVHLSEEQWFEPAEGLKTVQGLLDVIRRDPSRVRNADVKRVMADLENTEKGLLAACERSIRFHFAVDY
jgi:hypothetical protein